MPVILLTNKYSEKVLGVIRKELPEGFDFISLETVNKQELIIKAAEADYFLASGRLSVDKEVIQSAKKLKMIQRTGVGTDTLDLAALKERGLPVYINSGINATTVAEHTVLLILSALRLLPSIYSGVKAGKWEKNDVGIESRSLKNKVIGIIGMGNVGRNVVKMLHPFGVKIFYNKPQRLNDYDENKLNIQFCGFEYLLQHVDILSLHCPLTTRTKGLIGKAEIASMKSGAFIINTSRGALIDEDALIDALISGHIKAAGLDVFAEEPPARNNPLFELNNVILTPHIGGLTLESFSNMMRNAFENIRLFEMGKLDLIEKNRFQ